MLRRWVRFGAALWAAAGGGGWTSGTGNAAEVVVPAESDTALFATTPGNNLGGSDLLAVGATGKGFPARSLVRFDLSGVLADPAAVAGARLEFSVVRAPAGDENSEVLAYRCLTDWVEGRGEGTLGEPARAGEPTWTHRSHPDSAWSEAGGGAGVDYVATPSGGTAVTGLGRYAIEGAGMLADVQAWLAAPSSNRGWMLAGSREASKLTARRLGSKESATASEAPRLILTLSEIPRPRIDRWTVKDGRIELGFRGEAGNVYEVQSRAIGGGGLGTWTVVTQVVAKLVPVDVVATDPVRPDVGRVYRVADVGDVD